MSGCNSNRSARRTEPLPRNKPLRQIHQKTGDWSGCAHGGDDQSLCCGPEQQSQDPMAKQLRAQRERPPIPARTFRAR